MRVPRLVILISVAVALLILAALILRPVVVARSLREEVRELRPKPFSEGRLREWAASHGGRVTCVGSICSGVVGVQNWPLDALKLAPPTRFTAEIKEMDGQLVQAAIGLVCEPSDLSQSSSTHLIVHFARQGTPESKLGAHGVLITQEPIGKLPTVFYSVDLNATARDIALAYDANIWCLARIGGCTGPQQSPGTWALRKRRD